MAHPPAEDYAGAVEDFKKGGWVVSLFGSAGMLARMMLDDEEHPIRYWVRRTIAAAIVGVLAYFSLWNQPIDGLYKSVILCVAGMASPELVDFILRKVRSETNANLKQGKKPKRKKRK